MKGIFKAQRVIAVLFVIMAVIVFIYSLSFMTEYNDLFGLKLAQNKDISNFYENILQVFNRQIFVWAMVAVAGIVLVFVLEIYTRVPDRFALIVMVALMAACSYGAFYAIQNISAISGYYQALNFEFIALEGASDYELKLATFEIGTGIYIAQLAVCMSLTVILIASHIKFVRTMKGGASSET